MKRRKSFLGMFMLVTMFMLGIGYAAISDINLNISGNAAATASSDNFSVAFDNTITPTSDVSKGNGATASGSITNGTTATITVSGLSTKDDEVSVTYTIKNSSPELSAKIEAGSITNNNSEFFAVTAVVTDATITKGSSTTLVVTVKLVKTPATDVSASITVPIKVSPVQA